MQAGERASGYWYADDEDARRAAQVLNAMRRYRAAEEDMGRRTRTSTGLGDSDLAAIRYLVEAERSGREVSPKEIADALGISTASTTKLIDRLVKSGHAERRPHPTDRRGLIIVPSWHAELQVRSALADVGGRMSELVESLEPEDARAVTEFLARMTTALEVDDQSGESSPEVGTGSVAADVEHPGGDDGFSDGNALNL